VSDQCIDELSGNFHGQMLGDLEALDEIELSAEIDPRREVGAVKVAGIDQQVTSVDIGAIDPDTTSTMSASLSLKRPNRRRDLPS
jgi:hypothetical protein